MSSTPIAVNDATADVGIFLMLGALRQATIPLMAIREGKWRGETPIGHDPQGKTLGILGMGGIGRVNCILPGLAFSNARKGNGTSRTSVRNEDRLSKSFQAVNRARRGCKICLLR